MGSDRSFRQPTGLFDITPRLTAPAGLELDATNHHQFSTAEIVAARLRAAKTFIGGRREKTFLAGQTSKTTRRSNRRESVERIMRKAQRLRGPARRPCQFDLLRRWCRRNAVVGDTVGTELWH